MPRELRETAYRDGRKRLRRRALPALMVFAVLLFGVRANGQATSHFPTLNTLRTTREAHRLPRIEAARAFPVDLRGVVTFYDPLQDEGRHPALFVEDRTGGVFIQLAPYPKLSLPTGTLVEVTGVTAPGGYAPIVTRPLVRVLAQHGSVPPALRVTLPHMLLGVEDGQWVEVEGVVHSADRDGHHVVLSLATFDGVVTATMPYENDRDYRKLIDAKVLVRAVAAPLVDNKGQMTGVRLLCPGVSFVRIEQVAPNDPFALPLSPLKTILQFSPRFDLPHRLHVRGNVTLFWPGRLLCLQQGIDGLCVQTKETSALQQGDLVDVVGFPWLDHFQTTLSDATLRRAGPSPGVVPGRISVEMAFGGQHEAALVQMEGQLIGRSLVMRDAALLLSSGRTVFPVILPPSSGTSSQPWPAFTDGSKLLVTGVFSGKVDAERTTRREGIDQLESFQILLRSPADVVVLKSPSWWTAQRTLMALGLVACLTLAVLVWVAVLRRRVDEQTLVIRRSEERFRHLAEHDSLTGLASRASLHECRDVALIEARSGGIPLAVLMMDLDKFKQVNDTLGHAAGDEVLVTVARRLQASVRSSDILARLGGDEFLALMAGVADLQELSRIAAKIVENVAMPISFEGNELPISISIGISIFPEGGRDAATLLKHGDIAMYQAKMRGRNRYQFFSPEMSNVTMEAVTPDRQRTSAARKSPQSVLPDSSSSDFAGRTGLTK